MAQVDADSTYLADTTVITGSDSVIRSLVSDDPVGRILKNNSFLKELREPAALVATEKNRRGKEYLFYGLSVLILLFGMFKVFYSRYFNTIFRVFFNTSLRQTQLTDILLQAKLPSLIFNIFFIVTGGLYAWFIIDHYGMMPEENSWGVLFLAVAVIGLIYIGKYFGLKLIGWLSGMQEAVDSYIFLIFLINNSVLRPTALRP